MNGLIMVMICLIFDIILKSYYFYLYRKSSTEASPGYLKERKRMWMEGISLIKDLFCLIPVVGVCNETILTLSNVAYRYQESCHLIASMVLLVYFVISTYFMISQSFCYHYSVTPYKKYISATHLLLFFQVFTLKVDHPNVWYFSVTVSLFSLLSTVFLLSLVYIFAKLPDTSPYRRHQRLFVSLLLDSLSVTLSAGGMLEVFAKGRPALFVALAALALVIAAASAGLVKRKLKAAV